MNLCCRHCGAESARSPFQSEDKQHVRNRVFSVIEQAEFELHTTVFEKARSDAKARGDEYFYKVACFLHFKRILARIDPGDELLVVAASLGTRTPQRHMLVSGI